MPLKPSSKKALAGLLGFAVVAGLGWVDWRPMRPAVAPRVSLHRSRGVLEAGAGRVELSPPGDLIVAGYPPPRRSAAGWQTPLSVRALVLAAGGTKVGLVSLEILEVPETLAQQIRGRGRALGLDDVAVVATHVHSSFGGYDQSLLASLVGTGSPDDAIADHLVDRAAASLESALHDLRPARARFGTAPLEKLNRNRAEPDGLLDRTLRALSFEAVADGAPIGLLVTLAAHPTLVPRRGDRIDGDYPSRAMAALESRGGVVLLVQAAGGDASSTPPTAEGKSRAESMADRVVEVALRAIGSSAPLASDEPEELAFARVRIALPRAQAPSSVPGLLRAPASNLLQAFAPRSAELGVLRLGNQAWLFAPGEPTSAAAALIGERLAADGRGEVAGIVGLADGYVGYVESGERVRQGRGEARRALYEPDLLDRMSDGFSAALADVEGR